MGGLLRSPQANLPYELLYLLARVVSLRRHRWSIAITVWLTTWAVTWLYIWAAIRLATVHTVRLAIALVTILAVMLLALTLRTVRLWMVPLWLVVVTSWAVHLLRWSLTVEVRDAVARRRNRCSRDSIADNQHITAILNRQVEVRRVTLCIIC